MFIIEKQNIETTNSSITHSYLIKNQSHLLGNLLQTELLLDKNVLYAAYIVPHPLEDNVKLKITTNLETDPDEVLKNVRLKLIDKLKKIKDQCSDILD